MSLTISKAISALDTPTSLLPFFIKDAFDVTGRTVMAQKEGGNHEAREKFIEEAGTSLFWIGGIPFSRWIANQLFKNKIDSEIHFKRINQNGAQNYFANELKESSTENGKTIKKTIFSKEDLDGVELGGNKLSEIQAKLKKAGYEPNVSKGFYKKFHVRATAASILINLVVLSVALPQLNWYLSRKLISKETKRNKDIEFGHNVQKIKEMHKINEKKNKTEKINKNVSFGSLKDLFKFKELFNFESAAEVVQLEPVSGMLLLDYGISGSRVTITPRNNNERIENAIKEGGIIFFFYYATGLIKKGLAHVANKLFKTPIDIDYKVLNNKEFKENFKNYSNKSDLLDFAKLEKDDKKSELKVIKMIDKELKNTSKTTNKDKVFKNFTLKMAQKEDLIDVEFDNSLGKWIRHSKKYIQTDKIINLNNNLKTFYQQALKENKNSSLINFDKVISKTKKAKIFSIFANMAICCASLSFIIPKIQYIIREHRTNTKEAPGVKMYQHMAKNDLI